MKDYIEFLEKVKKPSRYIGGEWNACGKKSGKEAVSVCLAFPDLYELGTSGLGVEILYHIVNAREDAVAERVFAPDFDFEELLKAKNLELFSIESKKRLKEFDILGFSLEYELTYTNTLNMLSLAGIPLEASLRKDIFPLIVGGGPCCVNPEPIADFFDLFVIGDGEDAINDIVDAVKIFKRDAGTKKELLQRLAAIDGVYVPSFYDVSYTAEGKIKDIKKNNPYAADFVKKRVVDLNNAFFPSSQIVSFTQRVHDRLNIEVARGCPNACKFCQARNYYYPYRQREKSKILEYVKNGLKQTGFDEVALSSLSTSSYGNIRELVEELTKLYSGENISISLPSLRCDMFSLEILDRLYDVKRSGLTFALEAGTEKLRAHIGKPINEDNILNILKASKDHGWQLVKLYFMIGLPSEEESDIDGIPALLKNIKRGVRGLGFNISVSPFVPKAQTPFQWAAQNSFEAWKIKKEKLIKDSPFKLKFHDLRMSFLEGIFARGDRRLSGALKRAWEMGARFDQWSEHMKFNIWEKAFMEAGVDIDLYLRAKNLDDKLPWDHLTYKPSKEIMAKELGRNADYFLDNNTGVKNYPSMASTRKDIIKSVQKIRFRFSRSGNVRMLSHLEQIEMFRKIFRRAQLPLNYSKGFNPKPLVAFGPAISVGYSSEAEYVDAEFFRKMPFDELEAVIKKELPEGVGLISARTVPVFFPSIESSVNAARYLASAIFPEDIECRIDTFLKTKQTIVKQSKDGSAVEIEVKSVVRELSKASGGINMVINFAPGRNIKPERIIEELCRADEASSLVICRKNLYILSKKGELLDI